MAKGDEDDQPSEVEKADSVHGCATAHLGDGFGGRARMPDTARPGGERLPASASMLDRGFTSARRRYLLRDVCGPGPPATAER